MDLTAESLAEQIPYYLTQEEKHGLIAILREWPKPMDYYINRYKNEILQGDVWTKLPIWDIRTDRKERVDGIVLSNSCSIDPTNNRDRPQKITFAPLINLDAYMARLKESGVSSEQIDEKLAAIKEQRVHNVFYLPAGSELKTDKLVYLDDVHSVPAEYLKPEEGSENGKLATLSMVGFYLFLFKLSIHYCRFHENVDRKNQSMAH